MWKKVDGTSSPLCNLPMFIVVLPLTVYTEAKNTSFASTFIDFLVVMLCITKCLLGESICQQNDSTGGWTVDHKSTHFSQENKKDLFCSISAFLTSLVSKIVILCSTFETYEVIAKHLQSYVKESFHGALCSPVAWSHFCQALAVGQTDSYLTILEYREVQGRYGGYNVPRSCGWNTNPNHPPPCIKSWSKEHSNESWQV